MGIPGVQKREPWQTGMGMNVPLSTGADLSMPYNLKTIYKWG